MLELPALSIDGALVCASIDTILDSSDEPTETFEVQAVFETPGLSGSDTATVLINGKLNYDPRSDG
jgi:hypothetical protein